MPRSQVDTAKIEWEIPSSKNLLDAIKTLIAIISFILGLFMWIIEGYFWAINLLDGTAFSQRSNYLRHWPSCPSVSETEAKSEQIPC